ncbi:MAG: hypothetical protein IJ593_01550 [Lachnospiraceae bacterium]|nr:hypothetical protein [Lachnospiraceae bacterium]
MDENVRKSGQRDSRVLETLSNTKVIEKILNDYLNKKCSIKESCKNLNINESNLRNTLRTILNIYEPNTHAKCCVTYYTPAENLYALVFGIKNDEVYKFMPDDAEEAVEAVLNTLTNREKIVLAKRISGVTLAKVGEELGINSEMARQIELKAVRKLRHPARMQVLEFGLEMQEKCETELEEQKRQLKNKCVESLKKSDSEYNNLMNVARNDKLAEIKGISEHTNLSADSIDNLNLSVRPRNCLRHAGINSLYDLAKLRSRDLAKIRNLGRLSYLEIAEKAEKFGIMFNKDYDAVK